MPYLSPLYDAANVSRIKLSWMFAFITLTDNFEANIIEKNYQCQEQKRFSLGNIPKNWFPANISQLLSNSSGNLNFNQARQVWQHRKPSFYYNAKIEPVHYSYTGRDLMIHLEFRYWYINRFKQYKSTNSSNRNYRIN